MMNSTTEQDFSDYDYGLNPLWQVNEIDDFTEELIEAIHTEIKTYSNNLGNTPNFEYKTHSINLLN